METSEDQKVVFVDASVLINFLHLDRLDLFGALKELRFVIPQEVEQEILRPEQRARLQRALQAQQLKVEPSTDLAEIALSSDLRQVLARGEAASLALAVCRGGLVACDERGRFLSEARERLGLSRILNTPGFFVRAIRAGVLGVSEADRLKLMLESHRFKMRFASFAEWV